MGGRPTGSARKNDVRYTKRLGTLVLVELLVAVLSRVAAQTPPPIKQPAQGLSIEGRVVGEQGEPMARMHVLLSYPGEISIVQTISFTNEQGAFKLTGLKPGEYRVCADPGPNIAVIRGDGRFLGEQPLRACDLVSLEAYSLSGVEIVVRRGLLYSVSGSVIDAAGNPVLGSRFTFAMRDSPPLSSIDIKHSPDGRFVVNGVPPGDYLINARRLAPDGRVLELGSTAVRVGSIDVENVIVRTLKPARIVGRLEFAEGLTGPQPIVNVNTVGLRSRPPGPFVNASRVREDLTFEIDGLLGPQMLQAFGAMNPWTVRAIRYRGQDIYGKSVEFVNNTDPNDLVVVLTNQSAAVSAKLRAPADRTGDDTIVVLIPLDPKTRAPLENAAFRPIDAAGRFGLPLVRPGDYLIAAITREDAAGNQSSIVRRLMRVAQRITLAPGEQRVIELDLVRPR